MSEYKRLTERNSVGEVVISYKDENDFHDKAMKIANRLAKLEDEIENGTRPKLPCKIGDKIYTIYLDDDYEYKIAETNCFGFNIREDGIEPITGFCCYDPYRYGKFTDKTAAEKRLAELKGERRL